MLNKFGALCLTAAFTCALNLTAAANERPFTLQNEFLAPQGKCLAASGWGPGATASMQDCSGQIGQKWVAVRSLDEDNSFWLLQGLRTACLLSGNGLDAASEAGGAAITKGCVEAGNSSNIDNMTWMAVDNGNGTFKLKSKGAGGEMCLEGNRVAEDSVLGGNAFMAPCDGSAGQNWLIPDGKLVGGVPAGG